MNRKICIAVGVILLGTFAYGVLDWEVNRIYVDEGQSLLLRYKGPLLFGEKKMAKAGHWAEEGEIGILAKLRGPGRHFYCPIWWERQIEPDILIMPGQVGIVTCKLGDTLPPGEFLVDGDIGETKFKGILRKVLHPGRYRINPYGYEVEIVGTEKFTSGSTEKCAGWVEVPTGSVGVVTNLAANPLTGTTAGISDKVLPPGIYPINRKEQNIDLVEIGFSQSTLKVLVVKDKAGQPIKDENGEPKIADDDSGIQFPSRDGFSIHLDFTAIWGLMPHQAPHAVKTYGNRSAVEQKIVLPQIDSILRNNGSEYRAVQLLVGNDREKYQTASLDEFHSVLDAKEITLLYGLVRHVYIPEEVRKPIQMSFIADELTLTRGQEQKTAKEEAKLREAEEQVSLASETVQAETEKLVAKRNAEGNRLAEGIRADTVRLVAEIAKETAALEAQAEQVLGEAQNKGKQLQEEARSDRFRLAVNAFGTSAAYNQWVFAKELPSDVELQLLYAGRGTLWTDMANNGGDFGVRATLPLEGQDQEQK